MVRTILLVLLLPLVIFSQQNKIVKIIGANYFELGNGDKISLVDIKVEDTPANIRWCAFNVLNNSYMFYKKHTSADTIYAKLYKMEVDPPTDLSSIFLVNNIGFYIGNSSDQNFNNYSNLNKLNYNKNQEVELITKRPNLLLLGAASYFGIQSIIFLAVAVANNDARPI